MPHCRRVRQGDAACETIDATPFRRGHAVDFRNFIVFFWAETLAH